MSTPPSGLPPELSPRAMRERTRGPRRSRGRRVARVLSWVALTMSIVMLGSAAAGYVVVQHYQSRLTRISIALGPHTHIRHVTATPIGEMNVLLVGSDTRAGSNATFQGSATVVGARSDTIILVHIPTGAKKPIVVSFPRDSWVQIPAWTAGGTSYPEHYDKINAAFSEGGPPLLIATIENLTGLQINHYAEIDFAGFANMVNALGGVTLCVKTSRHDLNSGDFLTAGIHHVNGRQALSFVRDRYGLPASDFDRILDQQYFLTVMLKKVESAGTLANPFKLTRFLNALTASVTVDQAMTLSEMERLAGAIHSLSPSAVTFVTIPYLTGSYWPYGQSAGMPEAVELNAQADDALWNQISHDSGKPTTTPPPSSSMTTGASPTMSTGAATASTGTPSTSSAPATAPTATGSASPTASHVGTAPAACGV